MGSGGASARLLLEIKASPVQVIQQRHEHRNNQNKMKYLQVSSAFVDRTFESSIANKVVILTEDSRMPTLPCLEPIVIFSQLGETHDQPVYYLLIGLIP
jgi:hypothetical protein